MLEQMRRQGASIFVYLIFCLLILIFVINFRPGQSRQDDNGCRGTTNTVISVDGVDATQTAFKIAYSGNNGQGKQKTYTALEWLIRRELLAQAAEARGLIVDDELVMNEIKQGHFFYAGNTIQIPGIFDQDHVWNLRQFENWHQNVLNVSRNSYIEEQKRGLLAAMMADILKESVQVSRDEALAQFLFEHNTAAYDVVAFKPETYRAALQITDADVDRFADTHADEINARFKADERLYKGTKPALLLRQIFIAVKPDAGSNGITADTAKAKLEQAKKAIGGDKAKFAAAAKDLSTDPAAKASGGSLGWHTADNAMLGDKAVTDAVKAMKPGDVSDVIVTDKGAYLLLAEDKREGDLKLDQVKHEIADTLAKDSWSREAAKRAALTALASARGNGLKANLDELYKPVEQSNPGINEEQLEQMLEDPNTDPAIKQRIMQMLQSHGQHGMRTVESKDIPAGWFTDDSDAVDDIPSLGSAIPASGSAAGSAAGPAAPLPEPDVVASKDQLPAMTEVEKPGLEHVPATPRQKALPGLGSSKQAATAVFDELKPGDIAAKVYDAGGSYVLVQLRDRQQPNVTDFDKDADDRVAQLRTARAQAFLETWLKTKCQALAQEKKIIPATEKITERDDNGKLLPITYRPCQSFR
jgi:parvulin-like peptidyl-prolyl isomerase